MKKTYNEIKQDMLDEINRCQALELSDKESAEKCFWIARNYSRQLKERIKMDDFTNDDEEIDFFRNIKPHFVCYIEYFLLISDALIIVPAMQDEYHAFWITEKGRLKRFRQVQAGFINYYESGQHDSDVKYFLRRNNDMKFLPNLHIYDADIDWCTSHDRLVRNYLAYKMYSEYCNKKINEF